MADEGGPLLFEEGNEALFLFDKGIDASGFPIEEGCDSGLFIKIRETNGSSLN